MLTDTLCASIAPDGATLLHLRKGWRTRLLDKWQGVCEPVRSQEPWRAGLEQLGGLLKQSGRRLPLTVVLSNRLARYRIVPAPRPFMADKDVEALLRHSFREVYGEAAERWSMRANPLPGRDTVVGCAVDTALLDELKGLCSSLSIPLASAQPDFMTGFNQARKLVRRKAVCFVQIEPGHCVLGLIRDGAWQSINAVAVGTHWHEELPSMVRREMLVAGWEGISPEIVLSAPDRQPRVLLPDASDWVLHYVAPKSASGFVPGKDQPFAMALRGA
ncbi:MAG TPA: hypothetical protein VK938_05110 [Methylophilaceae bacterium]|jgi:hypothetical protein|nr:hypothetical protein [Methylophilaceae bacterium]